MQLIQNTSMFADLLNEIKCTSRVSGVRCLFAVMYEDQTFLLRNRRPM